MGSVALLLLDKRRLVTVAVSLGFVAVGLLLGTQATSNATTTSLRQWYERQRVDGRERGPVDIEGRLRRDAFATESGVSLDLGVERLRTPSGWVDMEGGLRVTVSGALVVDRIEGWREGRMVKMPVTLRPAARYLNPGVPDQERVLMWRGTSLLGSVKSGVLVDVVGRGGKWSETAAQVRSEVRRRVERAVGRFSKESASVVTAVLIGDRAGIGPDARRRLQEGGTYHVIAISGGNVAILSGVLLLLLRLSGCSTACASILTVGCLVAYGSLVGAEASVTRATFAASVFLVARAIDHRAPPLNTLALSATCLVAHSPLLIVDAGFLLTFGATLGILVGVVPVIAWTRPIMLRGGPVLGRLLVSLVAMFAATVCAELALLPISSGAFSRVTAAGLLLNFVAIPLMTVVQVAGLGVVGVSLLSERGADMVGYIAHLGSAGILDSARLVDVAPWLSRRVPAPGLPLTALYYGGWILLLGGLSRPWVRAGSVGLVVVTATSIIWGPVRLSGRGGTCSAGGAILEIVFLDVDQADATLVVFPSGRSLLVDAAGTPRGSFDVGSRIVAPVLWRTGVRRLDYLAVTHAHPDHIGGAVPLAEVFKPREIWEGIPVPRSHRLRLLEKSARQVGTAWRVLQRGDLLTDSGVVVRVWYPETPRWERQEVRNDDSLVIEIRYGAVSIVLPGDIGQAVEAQLLETIPPAPFRVLKVPHHGSRSSSSARFVAALRPAVAVVSAGRNNRFGHPAPEVVLRYEDTGAEVLQTGEVGAVSMCTDGSDVSVATQIQRQR